MITNEWTKSSFSGPAGDCVEVRRLDGGMIQVRDSKNTSGALLSFTPSEWSAFIKGAKAGEFDLV